MAPLGNTMSLRLVGFLLGAIVLFSLAIAFAFLEPLGRDRVEHERLPLPRQAAAIVDALELASPGDRPRLLDALNSSSLSVKLLDALPASEVGESSAPVLTRFLNRYDEVFATHDIHVDVTRQDAAVQRWRPIRLYVRLNDGPWVLMEPVRRTLAGGVVARGSLIIGFAGVLVIALLVLAVRQTARPIEKLASNAREFAERFDTPDLEERGPKELRQLAATFNDMKRRIRSLVQERTRVVAAVAHDLRTYMTRLRLRVEFISDPTQRERAERDIDEMSALIGDTLLFARSTDTQGDNGVSTDLVAETEAFVRARTETGDSVTLLTPPEGALFAHVDPVGFRRILANLTDNAIRYGAAAELLLKREDKGIVVEVADRGPGIPESDLGRVTAPFERLEPSRGRDGGGAGLGLAIVKALAESHGGAFTLTNRPGGGIVARVSLKPAGS